MIETVVQYQALVEVGLSPFVVGGDRVGVIAQAVEQRGARFGLLGNGKW
ncbi:hypothetical protein GF420_06780 [candidate division GN15 bacterium]|nr:hypothetical protein [candidate division GN15 bacterium]